MYHLANDLKTGLKDVLYGERLASTEDKDELEVAKTKLDEGLVKIQKVEKKGLSSLPSSKLLIDIYKETAKESVKEFERKTSQPVENAPIVEVAEEPKPKMLDKEALSKPVTSSSPVIDIFAPLKEAYGTDDIKLIRKIFASFTKHCPLANRALLEELKKKAIKELSNG